MILEDFQVESKECTDDNQCIDPIDDVCCFGECRKECPCKEDADCPADKKMCCWYNGELYGQCLDVEECHCKCEKDSQCPEKYICCDGECRQPEDCDDVTPMECKFTNECPTDGDVCCKGYCVPPEKCPCQTVFDCPDIKHRCCKGQCLPPLNDCIYGAGCCNGECLPREECNDIFPK